MLGVRAATDQYRTLGESGVDGLKCTLRYLEVRFEYAGESINEMRDEGNGKAGEMGLIPGIGSRTEPMPMISYRRLISA